MSNIIKIGPYEFRKMREKSLTLIERLKLKKIGEFYVQRGKNDKITNLYLKKDGEFFRMPSEGVEKVVNQFEGKIITFNNRGRNHGNQKY